nr:hypothetical protein [Chlamydia abortus]
MAVRAQARATRQIVIAFLFVEFPKKKRSLFLKKIKGQVIRGRRFLQ